MTQPEQCQEFGLHPDEACAEADIDERDREHDDWDWDDVNGVADWEYEP